MATWISAFLPYIGGGVLGAAVTYGLTWFRERRRTLDAYRAPQRQAIGDILAATHEYMLRELEQRTLMEGLLEQVREDREIVTREESDAAMKASAKALLGVERALAVGRLTIVDAPCWEALGVASVDFSRLGAVIAAKADGRDMRDAEEIEHYVETVRVRAEQFNQSVQALVKAAADRVSPAETLSNRRDREAARYRVSEHLQQRLASDMPDPLQRS